MDGRNGPNIRLAATWPIHALELVCRSTPICVSERPSKPFRANEPMDPPSAILPMWPRVLVKFHCRSRIRLSLKPENNVAPLSLRRTTSAFVWVTRRHPLQVNQPPRLPAVKNPHRVVVKVKSSSTEDGVNGPNTTPAVKTLNPDFGCATIPSLRKMVHRAWVPSARSVPAHRTCVVSTRMVAPVRVVRPSDWPCRRLPCSLL